MIKHQAKARGIISFMPVISVVIDLKHVIRDRRSRALHTLFFSLKFWRLRHFCTFSKCSVISLRKSTRLAGFSYLSPAEPQLHVHSTSSCLKPFSLTNSEPAPKFPAIWQPSIKITYAGFKKVTLAIPTESE